MHLLLHAWLFAEDVAGHEEQLDFGTQLIEPIVALAFALFRRRAWEIVDEL